MGRSSVLRFLAFTAIAGLTACGSTEGNSSQVDPSSTTSGGGSVAGPTTGVDSTSDGVSTSGATTDGNGTTDGGGTTTGASTGGGADTTGTTSSGDYVSCSEARGGEPCEEFDMCGVLDGYGCTTRCVDGAWDVTCTEPPTCADVTVEQGAYCDTAWGPANCGLFQVDSACGEVSVTATCTNFGWQYDLPCDPACEGLDEASCGATIGCFWAVSCDSEILEVLEPVCVDFAPWFGGCDFATCSEGTSCHEIAYNQRDPGNCENAGTLTGICVP